LPFTRPTIAFPVVNSTIVANLMQCILVLSFYGAEDLNDFEPCFEMDSVFIAKVLIAFTCIFSLQKVILLACYAY